ncbi:hypothetical protein [Methanoculleus frigidifontis]|uniref:hypothetical protein n=1 Tax=Methanoculleus frigidifontis TaxID=2584085 RepID=UPI002658522F|nr:hypothetical protein [Methanoculleus sp. FWC-SCC1]
MRRRCISWCGASARPFCRCSSPQPFISAVFVFTILFAMGAGAGQFASGMAYVPPPLLLQETVDSLLTGLRDMALALLLSVAFFLLDVALRPEQGDGYGE